MMQTTIQTTISKLVDCKDLTKSEARAAMEDMMSGRATDAQIAGFLIALRMKGETIDEIAAFAEVMRAKATHLHPKVTGPLVDTCGTGGDCSNTFNISTAAAFVAAGAGACVAKHGNRSISSKSGSADVLTALGVNIELSPEGTCRCIEEIGIGFMFAPLFHGAMKYAIGPRKELGVRTVFNMLGPLTNPAGATAQVVGVYDPKLVVPIAHVLKALGTDHGFVVHGSGLDEVSLESETTVAEITQDKVSSYTLTPDGLGFTPQPLEVIKGGAPEDNAQIIKEILKGKNGPHRDIVALNAGLVIVAADLAKDLHEGIKLAQESIDSGEALKKLNHLVVFTNDPK